MIPITKPTSEWAFDEAILPTDECSISRVRRKYNHFDWLDKLQKELEDDGIRTELEIYVIKGVEIRVLMREEWQSNYNLYVYECKESHVPNRETLASMNRTSKIMEGE